MPKENPAKIHAFWSGTITFGLVSVPINMFPANRSGGVRSRMLSEDDILLRRRFFCPEDEQEVGPDDLMRGYEIEDGEYVVVTDEELDALAPRKSRDIDLRAFVNEDQIEPLYFERSYFLTPAGETNKAYRLLAESMERQRQAGVATFVMHGKEYLVAILSQSGILRAETMRFKGEVRSPNEVGLEKTGRAEEKRVAHIVREIKKLEEPALKPAHLHNEYSERLSRLIEQKRKHHAKRIKVAEPEHDEEAPLDLVSVLKRSLSGESRRGDRSQTGNEKHERAGGRRAKHSPHSLRRRSTHRKMA